MTDAVTFDDLPADVRRRVERLAFEGKRYPDRDIAAVAYAWARAVSPRRTWVSVVLAVCADTALSAWWCGSDGSAFSVAAVRRRQLARKLRALGP